MIRSMPKQESKDRAQSVLKKAQMQWIHHENINTDYRSKAGDRNLSVLKSH